MSDQPESFAFTAENQALADRTIAKYPAGRQASAILPLLHLAQRQHDGWLPRAAIDYVTDLLKMPRIKGYEVATFYSMFRLKPSGRLQVEVCTTPPCWFCGGPELANAIAARFGTTLGQTSPDGQVTVHEVECLGACVNAPMMQVGDSYFEDLTPEKGIAIVEALLEGRPVQAGPANGRRGSMALTGPTTLAEGAQAHGIAMGKTE